MAYVCTVHGRPVRLMVQFRYPYKPGLDYDDDYRSHDNDYSPPDIDTTHNDHHPVPPAAAHNAHDPATDDDHDSATYADNDHDCAPTAYNYVYDDSGGLVGWV